MMLFFLISYIFSCRCVALNQLAYGQNLIVFMIDGLSNKLLAKYADELTGFNEMSIYGSTTDYLKPVYPTLSYPNWISIFTGCSSFINISI